MFTHAKFIAKCNLLYHRAKQWTHPCKWKFGTKYILWSLIYTCSYMCIYIQLYQLEWPSEFEREASVNPLQTSPRHSGQTLQAKHKNSIWYIHTHIYIYERPISCRMVCGCTGLLATVFCRQMLSPKLSKTTNRR